MKSHALVLLWCAASAVWLVPAAGAVPTVAYDLDRPGLVSVVIFGEQGRVVRELLHAAPRAAGRHQESWDGLDDKGQPVAAGDYSWKLLASDGLKAEYLMSLGTTAVPPWKQMPGNHGGVSSIAVDEAGFVYVSAGCSEGPPQIVKQSLDGAQREWDAGHVFDGWQGGVASAALGDTLYAMQPAGIVMAIDGTTGKRKARWELWWDKDEKLGDDGSRLPIDLAGRGDQLVMAHLRHDAIRWIDPATGAVLDEAPIPAPQSVAIAADGRVFVLSNDTVVALTRAEKQPVPVIGPGALASAYRIDVCPATGDILVVDRGEGNRIKRFSAKGELIQTLGRAGGRRQGAYYPNDFGGVFDLTADGTGGFFICESWNPPRRTARFDREGKLVSEWYGGQMYANHAVADPLDPTIVWVDSHFGTVMQVKVDYVARTWNVLATYSFGGLAEGIIAGTTHGGGRFFVRHHDGRTYLCRDDKPDVLQVDETNRRLVPMVGSYAPLVHGWKDAPRVVKQAAFPKHDPNEPFPNVGWDAFGHRGWLWVDGNNDARPQVDEIQFGKFWGWTGSRWHVDEQLTYHRLIDQEIHRFPVRAWHGAVPDYENWDRMDALPAVMPDRLQAVRGDLGRRGKIGVVGIWPDGSGGWFAALNDGMEPYGMGFMSAQLGATRVVRWDEQGRLLWEVGRHSADLRTRPGEARSFFRIAGTAHGCVAVTDIECYYEVKNLVHVWDRDGLWVGRLLENPDLAVAPAAAYTLCTENFGGSLIEITADMKVPGLETGDVVFFGSGQNDTRVYRINGWDTMRRQAGTLRVAPEFAATLAAAAKREAERTDLVRIGRVIADKADADLRKWADTVPLEIRMGDEQLAKLYLGWNPQGLFACFDVTTDRPWTTTGAVQTAFTGGAAVDVNLGPLAPADRTKPVLGDARFVAAPLGANGRVALVEFLPALPANFSGRAQPVTFETAAQGTVAFAHVGGLPVAAVAERLKPDDTGYVVEMQIPMRAPLQPSPGHRFKFDASVILADVLDGTTSDARLCWHSRAPEDQLVTADQVIEATLRPANWGEAVLE